jgi:hypothetical protein
VLRHDGAQLQQQPLLEAACASQHSDTLQLTGWRIMSRNVKPAQSCCLGPIILKRGRFADPRLRQLH